MKTKTKTKKPKPQPKQKKLAPGWRHGNTSLVLLVVVIVAIVAGGVGWMLARNTQAPTEKPIAQKPSVQNDYPEKWQTYTNEDLGYKITFPKTWKGYRVEETKGDDGLDVVSFGKFSEQPAYALWTFGIEERSAAKYQEDLKENPYGNLVYLGKGANGNVIVCSGGCCSKQGMEKFIDLSDDKFGQARCAEVPEIMKTFQIFQAQSESIDETENWQTYKGTKYGYSVKYPNNWFAYTDDPGDVFFQPSKENSEDIPGPHADALEITMSPVNQDDTLAKIIQNEFSQSGVENTQESILIGGVSGMRVVSTCEGMGCGAPEWFVINKGILYHFSSNLGYSDTFDKILATFKFTN